MAPWWARSLRGRVTLIATAVAALVLIPVGIAGVLVTRSVITAAVFSETRDTAERVAYEMRGGALPMGAAIPVPHPTVDLIQVVGPDGRILATSDAARNLPPLSDVRPTARNRVVSTTSCLPTECVHLTAVRVSMFTDSPVVYAGRSSPEVLSSRTLEVIVFAEVGLLIGVTAWATWLVTGRALRPVATMRAELDAVHAGDLSHRVTQPPGDDEVAELARSVNSTLTRLERSAEQQRQFASDASHELRTPIAGLRAQLESAQLYPDDTDMEALVRSALRDTDRLEAIITDLLLLARIGSRVDVVKERVDLADLVRKELAVRSDKLPVRVELAEGVVVEAVRLQLARVLTNLVDNAQRHAEHSVKVTVRRQEPDTAVLAVENDGMEIAECDRERIFERFTRLDAARSRDAGGTGLGLAIARDVAMAHRGEIRVEDCPGGARFVLRLPMAFE
ncbi:HAMP domain-containing sensor histidine kinase [Nonomuraea gerenzanensis]|uniref:histidine kinase n=1 Tax=Nonomuraea gerenzanensis TaxID=93944 RepID=A0A1M4E842_9ACTN|nr:HAMP domain-containing sensor histidine kinase [Nonomuraea gerenzanensis]UBU17296.1 HAMP domain-containing histidine kinase [Nonomuraea gerenzanensis]SBO95041.1 probable two-component sensor kinase [Nonomuraea gerenzanensis]